MRSRQTIHVLDAHKGLMDVDRTTASVCLESLVSVHPSCRAEIRVDILIFYFVLSFSHGHKNNEYVYIIHFFPLNIIPPSLHYHISYTNNLKESSIISIYSTPIIFL